MPTRQDFISKRPAFTVLLNSYFGSGKTLQAHSFPKCYTISIDPAGLETLRIPSNKKFLNNLVEYDELGRETLGDLRAMFKENATANDRNSLYGCVEYAKTLAAKGEVETLVIDGGTYLCDLVWAKICELEEVRSEKSGVRDSMAMYRNLGLYLQRMFMSNLLTVSTRNSLNLIITFHLKRESELQLKGAVDAKSGLKGAGKVMQDSDIALQIEGSMRNKIEGLFGASIYLEKTLTLVGDKREIHYRAICDVAKGFNTTIVAKNRWGLAPRISLDDKTLYEALMESLNSNNNHKPTK